MKKLHILIPSLVATIGMPFISLTSCGGEKDPEPEIIPTGITLSETSKELKVGDTFTLTAIVKPEGVSQDVEWSSDATGVATVDDGEVTAIGEGTAIITVKPIGYDIPATCVVHVTGEPEPAFPTFTIDDSSMVSETVSNITLKWTPNDEITFTDFYFLYEAGEKSASVTQNELISTNNGSLSLKLAFNESITSSSITDGVLIYHFNDTTQGIEMDWLVPNIKIRKYSPVSHPYDFNSCEWNVIVDACNSFEETQDIDAFCNLFYLDDLITTDPDDRKDASSLSDFIGQKRNITVNSQAHQVIVLDYQKDTI